MVVIVGPVGELTDRYLARGEAAAREAERFTPNVTRVFSPDATWPVVREALRARIWSSTWVTATAGRAIARVSTHRRRTASGSTLWPAVATTRTSTSARAPSRGVRLGPNAIVLLHHLCYASGNTEPGLDEGTPEQARERVDNYAAGFIAAGAEAVVAEGHLSPAWYVRSILADDRTIEDLAAGTQPQRQREHLREQPQPGVHRRHGPGSCGRRLLRSIVARPGADWSPTGGTGASEAQAGVPTLVGAGLQFGRPYLKGRPVAGSTVEVWIPYEAAGTSTPHHGRGPLGPSMPRPCRGVPISLVAPERIGSVVEPVPIKSGPTRLVVPIAVPAERGRHRLVLTLRRTWRCLRCRVAGLLAESIVRVAGQLEAAWSVVPELQVSAGLAIDLPVVIANVGAERWGRPTTDRKIRRPGFVDQRGDRRPLVALDPDNADTPPVRVRARHPGSRAGAWVTTNLRLVAPARRAPMLLDVVVPGHGSLAARGIDLAGPRHRRVAVPRGRRPGSMRAMRMQRRCNPRAPGPARHRRRHGRRRVHAPGCAAMTSWPWEEPSPMKRFLPAVLVSLALTVAACGSNDPDDGGPGVSGNRHATAGGERGRRDRRYRRLGDGQRGRPARRAHPRTSRLSTRASTSP